MKKSLIITIFIVIAAVIVGVIIFFAINSNAGPAPAEETNDSAETSYQTIDPVTGDSYTVNGVTSGETFEKPWVYGLYSLKQAGLSQSQSEQLDTKLAKHVTDTYKSKYSAITILSPSIKKVGSDEYSFSARLGEVSSNTYLKVEMKTTENDASISVQETSQP